VKKQMKITLPWSGEQEFGGQVLDTNADKGVPILETEAFSES
jgi:hypothetical protein